MYNVWCALLWHGSPSHFSRSELSVYAFLLILCKGNVFFFCGAVYIFYYRQLGPGIMILWSVSFFCFVSWPSSDLSSLQLSHVSCISISSCPKTRDTAMQDVSVRSAKTIRWLDLRSCSSDDRTTLLSIATTQTLTRSRWSTSLKHLPKASTPPPDKAQQHS